MRSALFWIVVVVFAAPYSLILLKWRFGNDCSGNYQPRALTAPVIEVGVRHV